MPVGDLEFSPNGAVLAAIGGGDYRMMNAYDVATGEQLVSVLLASQPAPRRARWPTVEAL